MSTTRRRAACSAEDVFRVMADGWSYPSWVVGAARVRAVDTQWPQVDARIHHSVGTWPLILDDTSSVMESQAPNHLRLRVRAWPAGEAEVDITVADEADGCLITMTEVAVRGPAKLIPGPVENAALRLRNRESLMRLAFLAERRSEPRG